jgi:hypothetical protein
MDEGDTFGQLMAVATAHMPPEAEESLWLNLAVAAKIADDPERVLVIAMQNLRKLDSAQNDASIWPGHWRTVLNAGVDAVIAVLTSRDPVAVKLRQNSPFAGVLSRTETERAMEAFRRHRKQAHSGR